MDEMTPIVRGAKYRDVSQTDTHGDTLRVKSVWVDEDAQTHVTFITEDEYRANPDKETVDLESFIEQINTSIIRVNSDHEAWEWRN
jgi:hypothetical protein